MHACGCLVVCGGRAELIKNVSDHTIRLDACELIGIIAGEKGYIQVPKIHCNQEYYSD